MYKQVNEIVLDTATVIDATSTEIGQQPAETVDTLVAAVVTIAKALAGANYQRLQLSESMPWL